MYKIINIITNKISKLIKLIIFNNKNKINKENINTNKSKRNRYGFPVV